MYEPPCGPVILTRNIVYPKSKHADLTPAQIRILRRLVEEEFK